MKKMILVLAIVVSCGLTAGAGGQREVLVRTGPPESDRLIIRVTPGGHYLHRLKVSWWLTVKNAPQMAVWLEDTQGRYLRTLYVTRRAAERSWRSAPLEGVDSDDIRRPSALPVWQYLVGYRPAPAGSGPARAVSGVDAVTAATPKKALILEAGLNLPAQPFAVMLEVNSSTDFNQAYPHNAEPGQPGYSGGPWGSGQPALLYRAVVDPGVSEGPVEMILVGHASPDGSDGSIRSETVGLMSALDILEKVTVEIAPPR